MRRFSTMPGWPTNSPKSFGRSDRSRSVSIRSGFVCSERAMRIGAYQIVVRAKSNTACRVNRLLECECEEYRPENEHKTHRIIPFDRLAEIKECKDQEQRERQDFRNDL